MHQEKCPDEPYLENAYQKPADSHGDNLIERRRADEER
jgi:hypothetical protein